MALTPSQPLLDMMADKKIMAAAAGR